MRTDFKTGMLIIAAAVLGAASMTVFLMTGDDHGESGDTTVVSRGVPPRISSTNQSMRVRSRRRIDDGRRVVVKGGKGEKVKPDFSLDDEDEAKLTEAQRNLINEIRAALERNSQKEVLRLVQKLKKSKEWPDGIPKAIKMAAIDALGWFGSGCLPEIAGFLADGDSEVVQSAIEKYEEALSDSDLSDYERSLILIQAAKVIDDADAMDSMLFELDNMRHSVAVATLKELMVSGNAATKSVLPDNIEFYTGEEGVTTPEQLDEWLKKTPDEEGDDEFYGGSKQGG